MGGLSCADRSAPETSEDNSASRQWRAVELPSLDAFPESVRRQLLAAQASLESGDIGHDADAARLGANYGKLGKLLFAYDLHVPAEPALRNATDLVPGDVRSRYYLGHLYREQGRWQEASEQFARVVELQPDYVPARIQLARVYRDMGREDDSEALLRETVRRDPQSAVAHLLLGQIVAEGNPQEAIEHYETVLRLQPHASIVHYPLGLAYRKHGDLERGRQYLAKRGPSPVRLPDPFLEELNAIREGAGAKVYRGNKLMEQGGFREAVVSYEAAAREDSSKASAFLNLATAYAQTGDVPNAIRALEWVLRLEPSNSAAHFDLGVLTLLFGAPDSGRGALDHFRAALAADPRNNAARLAVADLLWRGRRCREAIAHYDTFLTARSAQPQPRIRKAICHAQLGEFRRVREVLEVGYKASPEEPSLQEALARVLAASPDASVRDGERALEIAQRLATSHPRAEMVEVLAMALAELGRFAEAIRYQRAVVRSAEQRGVPAKMLEHLRGNLRRYEQGTRAATPWPPTVFDP